MNSIWAIELFPFFPKGILFAIGGGKPVAQEPPRVFSPHDGTSGLRTSLHSLRSSTSIRLQQKSIHLPWA